MHTTINHINCKTHLERVLGLSEIVPHLSTEDVVPVALCRCRLPMSRATVDGGEIRDLCGLLVGMPIALLGS